MFNSFLKIIVFGFLMAVIYFGLAIANVQALSVPFELHGYAWSNNIGWISFNCANNNSCAISDYKVEVDSAGYFKGYAWSDNVGWISFEPNDVSGCPSGICRAAFNPDTGDINGWARMVSCESNPACGGWISLNSKNCDLNNNGYIDAACGGQDNSSTPIIAYNVNINPASGIGSGWAWSDEVIGWISFNSNNCDIDGNVFIDSGNCGGDNITTPIIPYKVYTLSDGQSSAEEIRANGSISSVTINEGESVTLSWTLLNVTSPSPASAPSDSIWNNTIVSLPSGSSTPLIPLLTTIYAINYTDNQGQAASASVTVNVIPATSPRVSLSFNASELETISPPDNLNSVKTCPASVNLQWATENLTAEDFCTASGGWTGNKIATGGSGSVNKDNERSTTYALECTQASTGLTDSDQIVLWCPTYKIDAGDTGATFPFGGAGGEFIYNSTSTVVIDTLGTSFNEDVNVEIQDWGGLQGYLCESKNSGIFNMNTGEFLGTSANLDSSNYETSGLSLCLNDGVPLGEYILTIESESKITHQKYTKTIILKAMKAKAKWKEIRFWRNLFANLFSLIFR